MNLYEKNDYRDDIDGLRAIAIISVVTFHSFPILFKGGFIGVDIFFVISGYLITKIICIRIQENNFSLIDFWHGRIRRIFPSLILVLVASLLIGFTTLLPNELKDLGKYVAASSIFIVNFIELFQAGYFDISSEHRPLLHIWSLSIEEQFYIFWPIFIYIAHKKKLILIKPILIIFFISFSINLLIHSSYPIYNFYLPITRFFEIIAGGLLVFINNKYKLNYSGNNLSIIGIFLIVISIFYYEGKYYSVYYALIPIFGTMLLIYAGENAIINKKILQNKILIFIGLISYPLYLWHWVLLSFAHIISSIELQILTKILIILFSILLSWLTYKYIEIPVRNSKNKNISYFLILTLILIGASTILIKLNDGYPNRVERYLKNYYANNNIVIANKSCINITGIKSTFCRFDESALNPSVVLIGDSIADGLYESLAAKYKKNNINLLLIGNPGCLPMYDTIINDDICKIKTNQIIDFIIKNENISTVIFSFWGNYYYTGNKISSSQKRINDVLIDKNQDDRKNIFIKSVNDTVKLLAKYDKKIIIISNAPEFIEDPRGCVDDFRPFSTLLVKKPACFQSKEITLMRNGEYLNLMNIIAKERGFSYIELQKILCDEEFCFSAIDGQLFYRDSYHLNTFGAKYVVNKIWKELK